MSKRTPATDEVKLAATSGLPTEHGGWIEWVTPEEFDRWLERVKTEARTVTPEQVESAAIADFGDCDWYDSWTSEDLREQYREGVRIMLRAAGFEVSDQRLAPHNRENGTA